MNQSDPFVFLALCTYAESKWGNSHGGRQEEQIWSAFIMDFIFPISVPAQYQDINIQAKLLNTKTQIIYM